MRAKYIFNPKKLLLLVFIGVVGLSGCKKFLDVNQDPNKPSNADPNLLLPVSQAGLGMVVGNYFQVYGNIWGQFWTQGPSASQYRSIERYNDPNTAFDGVWSRIYTKALINAQLIIDSKVGGLEQTKGIAYLTKAYTFQVATDAFGDIPVGDALQTVNLSPKYIPQAAVYDSIFTYIDKGIALINVANSVKAPGSQDIVFQGDMAQWKAFANTLKLKAYLRLTNVDPAKASAGIAALYATSPTFLTKDAAIKYISTGGNDNPLYNEIVGLDRAQNLVASATAVNQFVANSDPRVLKFYDPVGSDTKITALVQGTFAQFPTAVVSTPSALVGASPNNALSAVAPVKLISSSESYFLQAEAVARGWANGDANALFIKGISESFIATGITDPTAAATYTANAKDGILALNAAASPEAKVKAIIVQKYYAMCGFQGFEAWSEYRRTGYPDFLIISKAAPATTTVPPRRMLYPNSEAVTNLNYPGTIALNVPVWWGKKN
ncbi:SusD/RagB family nutrient-binding outer membrane lipoprotein [Pedobacter cryoconitis]|uniref:SusD-like starch-binding protein associating with outer membrane n=1 Tax=Pedobacter cryoconitis TaxID=188932 RepID=A0A327SXW8_9SPHI|nr:SusD/RagB family nutrient-binding outer membrane lipoprotein [Pedobacter cryoconitis]RAJ34220.1 SusD-like starch-binding protein associating with outer membrane [Pedobacter cryoconitis]